VGEDVRDASELGKTSDTDSRAEVVSEDKEGRSGDLEEAVVGEAVHDGAHGMLTDTEVKILSGVRLVKASAPVSTVVDVVAARSVEVGRAGNVVGNKLGNLLEIDDLNVEDAEATRVSGYKIIQEISKLVPNYVSGSADLHGSCRNYIDNGGNWGTGFDKSYSGKNLYFGIREHAMGSIMNGFAYHGLFKISGSTFLVFADYLRPTVRVAGLAELGRVSYIFTHDSIGVGEDGPTHQPVETVSGLRAFPNVDVFRPADAEETVAAFASSVTRKDGPTVLIFSRQNLDQNTALSAAERREGTLKGAYIAKKEEGDLDTIVDEPLEGSQCTDHNDTGSESLPDTLWSHFFQDLSGRFARVFVDDGND
jgi:hypothetical protein